MCSHGHHAAAIHTRKARVYPSIQILSLDISSFFVLLFSVYTLLYVAFLAAAVSIKLCYILPVLLSCMPFAHQQLPSFRLCDKCHLIAMLSVCNRSFANVGFYIVLLRLIFKCLFVFYPFINNPLVLCPIILFFSVILVYFFAYICFIVLFLEEVPLCFVLFCCSCENHAHIDHTHTHTHALQALLLPQIVPPQRKESHARRYHRHHSMLVFRRSDVVVVAGISCFYGHLRTILCDTLHISIKRVGKVCSAWKTRSGRAVRGTSSFLKLYPPPVTITSFERWRDGISCVCVCLSLRGSASVHSAMLCVLY